MELAGLADPMDYTLYLSGTILPPWRKGGKAEKRKRRIKKPNLPTLFYAQLQHAKRNAQSPLSPHTYISVLHLRIYPPIHPVPFFFSIFSLGPRNIQGCYPCPCPYLFPSTRREETRWEQTSLDEIRFTSVKSNSSCALLCVGIMCSCTMYSTGLSRTGPWILNRWGDGCACAGRTTVCFISVCCGEEGLGRRVRRSGGVNECLLILLK